MRTQQLIRIEGNNSSRPRSMRKGWRLALAGAEVGRGTAENPAGAARDRSRHRRGVARLDDYLMVALRNPPGLSSPAEFVSTVVLLSALPPPAGPWTQRRPATADDVAPLEPVESPIAVLPEISPPSDTRTGADWASDARRAAAVVTVTSRVRGFGESPEQNFARAGAQRVPAHEPGEQYRTTDGAWVVWTSDHCYLVSDVPPMGLPQVLARSIPTSTVCQGDPESRDDLFKDLPAYEKYHPR